MTNVNVINQHNILFINNDTSYTLDMNQFTDWVPSEFISYVNQGLKVENMKKDHLFVSTTFF